MQTQCPICEEVIRCDRTDVGKSRRCPVCEVDFVLAAIPTEEDLKQKADRRTFVVNYVIPVAATVLLFGSVAGAFWQRQVIRSEAEALAARDKQAKEEAIRLAREEAEKNQLAFAEQQKRFAAENAVVPSQASVNEPEKAVGTPDTAATEKSDGNKAESSMSPKIAEATLLLPEKQLDFRELLQTESEETDPVQQLAASRLYISSDQRERIARVSDRKAVYRHIWEGTRTELKLPEMPEPFMLFPVGRQPLVLAAVGADGVVRFFDQYGIIVEQVRVSDAAIVDCTMILGELFFATADGKACLYSTTSRRIVELSFPSPLRCVCAPKNVGFMTAGTDRQIHLFNSHDRPTASFRSTIPVDFMTATPVGQDHVVIVAGNSTIEALSQNSGTIFTRNLAGLTITDLAISEKNCLAVAVKEGLVFAVSLQTGQLLDVKKTEGSPIGIAYADISGMLQVWTDTTIDSGDDPVQIELRSSPDPMLLTAATDSTKPFPKSGDPEIQLMELLSRQSPLAIESLSTDTDSKVITIRGQGFSGVDEVTVLRPGESSVRLKATVVSDAELTVPWSPRVSGGIPVIQSEDRLAVPVPWQMRIVVPSVESENADSKEPDSDEETEPEQTPPDLAGFRYLTGNQEIAVVPEDCQFLLVNGNARITEAINGKAVIVHLSSAELPPAVSDNVRIVGRSPDQSTNRRGGKSQSLYAAEVFPCPVRDGIPLP